MSSIRGKLLVTLLGGMLSFYAVTTLVLYFYAEGVLEQHFDESLAQQLSTFTRMTERESDEFDFDFEDLELPQFEAWHEDPGYYQAWDQSGETLERSPSLEGADLPRPASAGEEPTIADVRLPNGEAGRAVVQRFWPRVERRRTRRRLSGVDYQVDVMIARSRSSLDASQAQLLRSFFAFGLILPLGTVLIVRWATGRGLLALGRVAEEISSVKPERLEHRFSSAELPIELRPLTERLNELLTRLGAAFERERRVTANVAHELRTPIAELRVLAEYELAQRPGGDEYLESVLLISERMEHLVTTLLALSRAEAGLETPVISELELDRVFEDAWQAHRSEAERKSVSFRFERGEPLRVRSDEALIARVATNLFSNAVSYVPPGGEILCRLSRDGERALVEIGNTTRDLKRDDLAHLFEPLWRKEASRSEDAHHGLGLCLVRAYADLLGLGLEADLPRPDWFQVTLSIPAEAQSLVHAERSRSTTPAIARSASSPAPTPRSLSPWPRRYFGKDC